MSVASPSVLLARPTIPVGVTLVAIACLLVGLIGLGLSVGYTDLGVTDVLRTLIGGGTERQELIIWTIRMPRVVIAMLVGIGLAVAGAVLQGISRNGLADPGLLGINASAGVAVLIMLSVSGFGLTGRETLGAFAMPAAALVGGLAGAALVYVLAYRHRRTTPTRLLLVGVAISFGATAIFTLLAFRIGRPALLTYAITWLEGSLSGASWEFVVALAPWIGAIVPFVLYRAQVLNVLGLGDASATGLGLAVERERLLLATAAVGLAASSVAIGGGIAFVGLVTPHIARRLVGPNHRVMLPATVLLGAALLVGADILARWLLQPFQIPVGIVAAAIGAPYFLFLLTRQRG